MIDEQIKGGWNWKLILILKIISNKTNSNQKNSDEIWRKNLSRERENNEKKVVMPNQRFMSHTRYPGMKGRQWRFKWHPRSRC
jgi:hypothetical protein